MSSTVFQSLHTPPSLTRFQGWCRVSSSLFVKPRAKLIIQAFRLFLLLAGTVDSNPSTDHRDTAAARRRPLWNFSAWRRHPPAGCCSWPGWCLHVGTRPLQPERVWLTRQHPCSPRCGALLLGWIYRVCERGAAMSNQSLHVHCHAGPHQSLMAMIRPRCRLSQAQLHPRRWQPP